MKRLFVGNLAFSTTEDTLREVFGQHGEVSSIALITDRDTGQPRGFGFIDMPEEAAEAAIQALDGQPVDGRPLRVNEARERQPFGRGQR